MLDELMFYPILKSRSHYKKYYLSNLLCKDTIFLFNYQLLQVKNNIILHRLCI